MPVDSALKRKSAATVATPWNGPSVIPSGGFSQADRQHIGWSYAGILAASPTPPVVDVSRPGIPVARLRYEFDLETGRWVVIEEVFGEDEIWERLLLLLME